MGFGDWVNSVSNSVVSTVDHVGNAVGHAVGTAVGSGYTFITGDRAGGQALTNEIDAASDAVFFDGTVAGINPALLHKYFHEGPGTQSYNLAEATLKSINSQLADIATSVQRASAVTAQGWQGQAAQVGLQDIATSQTAATVLAERAATKASAYTGQIQAFNSAKNSMVKMPDNPPPVNNPLLGNPLSAVDGTAVAAVYQAGTKGNQQAYSSYQAPTQTHISTIPQGAPTITPGQSNPDPGPAQPGGPGIAQSRSYSPTFGSSQYAPTGIHQQQGSGTPLVAPATVGPGAHPGMPASGQPPVPDSGGTSTGLASYGGPSAPTSGVATPGGYDTGTSGLGGSAYSAGGGGYGSVFAGGGYGTGGVGGVGASGARGGTPAAGNSARAGSATGENMAARNVAPARGAAGQAGGAGAPGAGGRGGKKEEDREHKTAAYLINEENGSEVVGDLPPSLPAGGVIGG